MLELLINGFEVDGFSSKEQSIFDLDRFDYDIFCSKNSQDITTAGVLLRKDPDQWYIFMIRDGRDVVVSKHNIAPNKYWANLMQWKRALVEAKPHLHHKRFVTVRYESLAANPDQVQESLMAKMDFLKQKIPFSEFHTTSTPSDQSLRAMRGVRPVSSENVSSWRKHKPRLAAQIELHGDISDGLINLGYETDRKWLDELVGITPDSRPGFWNDFPSEAEKRDREAGIWKNSARYLALRGFSED